MNTNKHRLGIVTKIMVLLNLGEEGRIGNFFEKQIKGLKRDQEAHKRNIENLKFNAENELTQLQDKLEDAKQEVENAYLNVTFEDVKTNADVDSFTNVYWGRITSAESKVETINKQIESASKRLEADIKATEDLLQEINRRIAQIEGN